MDETTHLLLLPSSYQHDDSNNNNNDDPNGQSWQQQQQQQQDADDGNLVLQNDTFPLTIMTAKVADAVRHNKENRDLLYLDSSSLLLPTRKQQRQQQQTERRQRVMTVVLACCICMMAGVFLGWSAACTLGQQQQEVGESGMRIPKQQQQQQQQYPQQPQDSFWLAGADESAILHQMLLQRRINTDTQIDQWEDWKKQHANNNNTAQNDQNNAASTTTTPPPETVNGTLTSSEESSSDSSQADQAQHHHHHHADDSAAAAAALWDGILRGISIPNDITRTSAFLSATKVVRFIDYSDDEDAVERFYEMTRYAPSSPMSSSDTTATTQVPPLQPEARLVVNTLPDTATAAATTTTDDADAKDETTRSKWKEKEAILEMETEEKWHEVQQDIHNNEDVLENDVEEKWQETQQEMHNAWTQLQNKSNSLDQRERSWWNQTVQEEDEWMQHVLQNLETFGQHVSTWWRNATSTSKSREVQLQDNFQAWWNHAQDEERAWWNDTRSAYSNFCQAAKEKEEAWWNATSHAMQRGWNSTTNSAQGGWNATSNAVHGTWNATQTREDEMLQNVKTWFKSHVAYHAQLNGDLSTVSYFNSSRDYSYLMDSAYGWLDNSLDFFQLVSSGWDAQLNQAYCAVASGAALLNSMPIMGTTIDDSDTKTTGDDAVVVVPILPMDPVYSPYRYATQQSILLTSCVNKHVIRYNESFDGVRRVPGGLSLNQAQKLLQCYLPTQYYDVTAVHVNPSMISLDEMRRDLYFALRDETARVVINYGRPALSQVGGGHFSPLVSYHRREDRFLILDVAKYKYPPVWVTAAQLYQAMSTLDVCGEWDYPRGQDILYGDSNHDADENDNDGGNHSSDNNNNEPLRYESNPQDYFQALHLLKCQTLHRGYIIVRPKTATTTPNHGNASE
jgi:Phytochelatin synthase